VEPIPDTQYAVATHGARIAYQVVGSGPVLLLGYTVMPGIDMMWEESAFVRLLERLSLFSRHVWFDARGHSSSSLFPSGEARITETITDNMATVLGALGDEPAVVLGVTGLPALLFAATHPTRTSALVLVDPSARFRCDDGYPGFEDDQVEQGLAMIEREWGSGATCRLFDWGADDRLQRWYGRCERLMYPPEEAVRVLRSVFAAWHYLGADPRRGATTIPQAEPVPVCGRPHR
jgi:pimeloyl-ACP methyl ester carboxylesterase